MSKKICLFCLVMFLAMGALYGCNDSDGDHSDQNVPTTVSKDKVWYKDADGDGYGDPDIRLTQSSQPEGYIENSSDCNDADTDVHPGAIEICDGKDNDCDGQIDEGACSSADIQITGKITNLDKVSNFTAKDSYLQLISLPYGSGPDYAIDNQGRVLLDSGVSGSEIPLSESFVFEFFNLAPGCYAAAVQLFYAHDDIDSNLPILSDDGAEYMLIQIPDDFSSPLVMDLGDLVIPVPAAKNQINPSGSAPSPPTGVSASDGSYNDRIVVEWDASAGATSYEIYRADSFMGYKSKIIEIGQTSYSDLSAGCGIQYYYWISAKNASGTSDLFYNDFGYRNCPVPAVPSQVAASDGVYTDNILITWNASSGATSYEIYRSNTPESAGTKIASLTGTFYSDYDVACPDTYYYHIKALNSYGASSYSASESGFLQCQENPGEPDPKNINPDTPLPIPTGLWATDGQYVDKIGLKWQATAGATAYDIYRSKELCGEKIKIGSSWTNSYEDWISPYTHTIYYYWLKAKNNTYVSEFSNYDTGYLMRKPWPPDWISASDGTHVDRIRVTWGKSEGAASYDVYRAAGWSKAQKTRIGTTASTTFDDTSVSCNSSCCIDYYFYWVTASNAAGTSDFSGHDDGYVYLTLQNPLNVKASNGTINCCVRIDWDVVAGAKSYEIYRASSPDGAKIKVGSTICDFFKDSTVTCPDIYYYWVKAVDAKGIASCGFGRYDSGYCPGCD